MSIGGSGNTVQFGIKAVADLKGVDDTSKALADLSTKGGDAGKGISTGMQQAAQGIALTDKQAQLLTSSLDKISKIGFLAGGAIFAGLGVAVKQASDLNESLNKSNVVFGAQAKQVEEFANSAAKNLGISKQAALETTATFGNLFKTMGLAPQTSADMSIGLVKLAADLASFNNVDPSKVLEDLQAGLVGEIRPLRQYGIEISDAAVQQELLKEGVKAVNGQFTDAQKVQARYNLILAQTKIPQGDFARTSGELANSMRIMRAELNDAAAALGSSLLPAVTTAVHGVTDLVHAFSSLPSGVQTGIAFTAVFGGGLLLLAAAGAKAISIGINTARTWTQVAEAFGETAVAADGAAGSMAAAGTSAEVADGKASGMLGTLGKLGQIAATGIIIGVTAVIAVNAVESAKSGKASFIEKWANDAVGGIADVIRATGGTQIADALDASVAAAQANMSARDITLGLGLKLDQTKGTVDKAIEAGVHGTVIGALVPDSWIPQVQHADDVIEGLGVTVAEVQKRADAAGVSFGDMLVKIADQAGVTTPQIEAYKQAQEAANKANKDGASAAGDNANAIDDQTASLQDQADAAIKAKKDQDELNRTIQATENTAFLAGAKAQGLYLPFTRGADDAQKATDDFNTALDGITEAALASERGVADLSSQLPGLQTGFGKVGESVVDVFRHMDDLGVIDLSPMARGALDAISTLDKVEAKIKGVESAIQQNQGDLNMWAGRISLVESVFGASTQTISEWVDELQNGQITQEQFNAAVASLGQGGFPKLDALLQQGKISQREYNDAKEAGIWLLQRSAGGMQDEDAQLVQNIIDLANYAKAHDDADGAVKGLTDKQREFVAAMGDAKTQTFLQTLQLLVYLATVGQIPASKVTKFIADSSDADPVLKGVIDDLGLLGDGTTVDIGADATGYDATSQKVKADTIPDKTVKVNVQVGDGTGDPNAPGFGAPTPDIPPITLPAPDPIPITTEDKTADGINAAETSLNQFGTDAAANASAAGTATGNAFSDGLAAGLQRSTAIAGASAAGILGALSSVANGVYNYGFNGGWNFGIGVANGIAATANDVFNAAFNVGYAAYLGTQAGTQSHSPSKLGIKSGKNWTTSVAMGITEAASDVLQAGKALGASLAGVISAPDLSPSLRAAALSADSRPRGDILASDRGGNVSHRSVTLNQTIHFDGITDTGEIIDRVNTQTYQALTRAQAAGAFGS